MTSTRATTAPRCGPRPTPPSETRPARRRAGSLPPSSSPGGTATPSGNSWTAPGIDKYGPSTDTRLLTGSGVSSDNGTKSTPALSGDIHGDWREEVVWRTSGNTALRIHSTPVETNTQITTLLHDTMYRTGLAWQNTAYNQPPHTGFFIGNGMPTALRPTVHTP